MSDFEMVREAISRRWGGDYRFPGMPEQLWKDANAALDRIEAENERLRARNLKNVADLTKRWKAEHAEVERLRAALDKFVKRYENDQLVIERLRAVEAVAREVCRPYEADETWSLEPLRRALEGKQRES